MLSLLSVGSSFVVQTVHNGSLTFFDTSLANFGSVVVRGPSAELVLENYYHVTSSLSYYFSDRNILEFFANSSLSLEQNATLRNDARSRSSEPGFLRFHGDSPVLSDGSATEVVVRYGELILEEVSIWPPAKTSLTGGHMRVNSASLVATRVLHALEVTSDSSYLGGTGEVEISGSMSWARGRMDGSGTTTVTGTLQLNTGSVSSYVYLQDTRTLVNNGTGVSSVFVLE
jgi:hypothetical protein